MVNLRITVGFDFVYKKYVVLLEKFFRSRSTFGYNRIYRQLIDSTPLLAQWIIKDALMRVYTAKWYYICALKQ